MQKIWAAPGSIIRYDHAITADWIDPHQYPVTWAPFRHICHHQTAISLYRKSTSQRKNRTAASSVIRHDHAVASDRVDPYQRISIHYYQTAIGLYRKITRPIKEWTASGSVIRYNHLIASNRIHTNYPVMVNICHHQTTIGLNCKPYWLRQTRTAASSVIRHDRTVASDRINPKYRPGARPGSNSHQQTPIVFYRKAARRQKGWARTNVLPKERGRKKISREEQDRTG